MKYRCVCLGCRWRALDERHTPKEDIPQTMRIWGKKQSLRLSCVLCVSLLLSCVLCLRIGEGSVTERDSWPKGKTQTRYKIRERFPVGVRGLIATVPKRSSLDFPNCSSNLGAVSEQRLR